MLQADQYEQLAQLLTHPLFPDLLFFAKASSKPADLQVERGRSPGLSDPYDPSRIVPYAMELFAKTTYHPNGQKSDSQLRVSS